MPNELSKVEVKLNEAKIDKILEKYEGEAGGLIPILQEVQETCGYLPEGILTYVSERSRVPLSKIYGIVTFYAQFSLVPRGRNTIKKFFYVGKMQPRGRLIQYVERFSCSDFA
ncbi:unnamed protein product [marine sediment metagenome]|uniref:NAD(P)H-dependent oxidoreductase subunit E n=1 Tax=marine sediment metagenome TaxID=412755 RepID=X1AKP1_9ZZZZ